MESMNLRSSKFKEMLQMRLICNKISIAMPLCNQLSKFKEKMASNSQLMGTDKQQPSEPQMTLRPAWHSVDRRPDLLQSFTAINKLSDLYFKPSTLETCKIINHLIRKIA